VESRNYKELHIISYHIISYHIMSYHVMSCHITIYHIIYYISYLHSPFSLSVYGEYIISPQHLVLKHCQSVFFSRCERPSFTPIQNKMYNCCGSLSLFAVFAGSVAHKRRITSPIQAPSPLKKKKKKNKTRKIHCNEVNIFFSKILSLLFSYPTGLHVSLLLFQY
jgi:hypothetical protein